MRKKVQKRKQCKGKKGKAEGQKQRQDGNNYKIKDRNKYRNKDRSNDRHKDGYKDRKKYMIRDRN
jgi:hypothetical protein